MQITLTDYDHSNMRRIGNIQHAFEAWACNNDNPQTHIVDVADFLEYCRDTALIHEDADISRHGAGLVRLPVRITGRFDAGRGEFYESEKMFSYTFTDFLSDFVGAGLTEALTKYINDTNSTKIIEA